VLTFVAMSLALLQKNLYSTGVGAADADADDNMGGLYV